jgi:AcrR family transcriptional regulator
MVSDGATLSSLSFVNVSQRAGVSRNSIYRRWKSKERLFIDVVKEIGQAVPSLTEHSARENLVMVMDEKFVRDMDPRAFRLERAINAEALNFPGLFEFYNDLVVAPRTNALKFAIRGGKDTGEIRVDVDEDLLVAVLVSANGVGAGAGFQRLVDLIFDGVSPT